MTRGGTLASLVGWRPSLLGWRPSLVVTAYKEKRHLFNPRWVPGPVVSWSLVASVSTWASSWMLRALAGSARLLGGGAGARFHIVANLCNC